MSEDKWKKLNDSNIQADFWKPEKAGDEVMGTYVDKRENVGTYHSTIYTLQKEDGTFVAVSGTTVIDNNLAKVTIGNKVKIVYTGKIANKSGDRKYNAYDVFVSEADAEKAPEVTEDVSSEDIPF